MSTGNASRHSLFHLIPEALARPCRTLRRFARDRAGAVALLFGLTLIPLLGFVGGAVDYAQAYRTRAKLQNAIDAAALTAGREIDMGATQEDAHAKAVSVLHSNLGEDFPGGVSANFTFNEDEVTAIADMTLDTFVLGVIGMNTIDIGVTSTVNIAGGTVEVALVLDNSGSMSGSKIRDLKDAAKRLTQILFLNDRTRKGVKMGVVPFAAAVNVGPGYANASWMDRNGDSDIHDENFDPKKGRSGFKTRFELFDMLRGTSWAGCVEVRPSPHDVTDSEPTGGDTLFVPMFAPDEPDGGVLWSSYDNSYLEDGGGSCKGRVPDDDEEAQERVCKYDRAWPSGGRPGPNYMCDPWPLQPLTRIQGQVISSIETMEAEGMTNIMEGVMWGWCILSPEEPFTEGLPYDEPENRKFMILMTDGANTHTGTRNQNMSRYSAFGYAKNGRLRSPTSSTSRLVDAMNGKTLEGCTNAKASGVIVFTIAFDLDDDDTVEMLRQCASGDSRAFSIDNGNALIELFEAIANEINRLRITS